jgi:hypothetical protein
MMRPFSLAIMLMAGCCSAPSLGSTPDDLAQRYSTAPWASRIQVSVQQDGREPAQAELRIACWPGQRWTITLERAEIVVEPDRLIVLRPGLSCLVYTSRQEVPALPLSSLLAAEVPALLAPELVVAETGTLGSAVVVGQPNLPTPWNRLPPQPDSEISAQDPPTIEWTTARPDGSILTYGIDENSRLRSAVLESDRGTVRINSTPIQIGPTPPALEFEGCTPVDSIRDLLPMDLTRTVGDRMPSLALRPIGDGTNLLGSRAAWSTSVAFDTPLLLDERADLLALMLIDGSRDPIELTAAYDLADQLVRRARVRAAEGATPSEGGWSIVARPVAVFDPARVDAEVLRSVSDQWRPALQPAANDQYRERVPLVFWSDAQPAAAMLASEPVRLMVVDSSGRIRALAPLSASVEDIEQALLSPRPGSVRP